jgi:hypothetical protein
MVPRPSPPAAIAASHWRLLETGGRGHTVCCVCCAVCSVLCAVKSVLHPASWRPLPGRTDAWWAAPSCGGRRGRAGWCAVRMHALRASANSLFIFQTCRMHGSQCVDGSDNRLGKFLFQIIEATRGGMPARDGNRRGVERRIYCRSLVLPSVERFAAFKTSSKSRVRPDGPARRVKLRSASGMHKYWLTSCFAAAVLPHPFVAVLLHPPAAVLRGVNGLSPRGAQTARRTMKAH